jgi:hypothetical protein
MAVLTSAALSGIWFIPMTLWDVLFLAGLNELQPSVDLINLTGVGAQHNGHKTKNYDADHQENDETQQSHRASNLFSKYSAEFTSNLPAEFLMR